MCCCAQCVIFALENETSEVTMSGFPHGPGYREDDPDLLLAIALSKSLMVRARHADGVRAGRQRPVPRPEANAPRLRR